MNRKILIVADLKGETQADIDEFNKRMQQNIELYVSEFKTLPMPDKNVAWSNGVFDPCYISEILINDDRLFFFIEWR